MKCAFLGLILIAVGCAASDTNSSGDDAISNDVPFEYDIPVPTDVASSLPQDEYVAGLEKESTNGEYRLQLLLSDPIPKYTDVYTWSVVLLDSEGNPVEDAQLVAEPTMPDHNHGTFPKFTTAKALQKPGEYQLVDMDLFMPGTWQIDIRITVGDGSEDQVLYWFALEG